MNILQKIILLSVAALSPVAAMAHHNGEYVKNPSGFAVAIGAASRSVSIDPSTRYINVSQGDVVQFSVDGKTFAWQFDTLRDSPIDLAKIAPADVHVHGVTVFVAPNPVLRN